MTQYPTEPLFTYASSTRGKEAPIELLFYRPEWTNELLEELAKTEEVIKTVGLPLLFFRPPEKEHLLVTSSIGMHLPEALDNVELIVSQTAGEIEVIKTQDVYNACKSPAKYTMSCVECLEKSKGTQPECRYAELMRQNESLQPPSRTCDELKDIWKSRKTRISDYTFIGPSLTSYSYFSSAVRPARQHDFSNVLTQTATRQDAASERYRYAAFTKEVCSQCFVKEDCWAEGQGKQRQWPIRSCVGNYKGTQFQTAKEIIRNVKIPFTNKQLVYLATNSGMLDKRYNSRKYFATFHIPSKQDILEYRLVRYTDPSESVRIPSFENARRILEAYSEPRDTESHKLSYIQKAAFLELVTKTWSPGFSRGGWRTTIYQTLGTIYEPWAKQFCQYFSWSRGGQVPWTVKVKDLCDIYTNYGLFDFAGKTSHLLHRTRGWEVGTKHS